jgi:hypothetical protein
LKNSPARIKMAKSGELNSLLDGTSPLQKQVRPVLFSSNHLVVQEREGILKSANRNATWEPASSKLRRPSVVIGGAEKICVDQQESRILPREDEE